MRRAAVLLVATTLFLGGLQLIGTAPPGSPEPQSAGAPPPAQPAAAPAPLEELRAKIAQGRHGEGFSLSLSQEELSALADQFLATHPSVPFANVRIAISGDKVIADASTRGLALTLPIRVTGAVGASNGQPWAKVEQVSLGGAGLPGFLREQVASQVNASLDLSRYPLPVSVEAVELRQGGLTVRGAVK
ncbi:MAG: LmeA family phospholipid-binding protein [Chloroflexi bacterium]|nr:LmeA family phospholipid-binding protein [Chloroflexota bacterium]